MNTAVYKSLTLVAALALPVSAFADHSNEGPDHHAMSGMQHGDHDHGHEHAHQHEDAGHHGHGEHEGHDHDAMSMAATITQTDDVAAALAAGGAPVVVDVLGVVCDFCATAMNKIFGKRDEVGRNRGWLKIKDSGFSPPASGWIVYVTKEKAWREATEMSCTPAERIVLGGESPGGAHAEKLGEFCRTVETVNDRPVYCRETRPNLMVWWAGGRWWLGKRDELGTNRGWIKAHSECQSPIEATSWMAFSAEKKKWLAADAMWCRVNDEHVPKAEPPPTIERDASKGPPSWEVAPIVEGADDIMHNDLSLLRSRHDVIILCASSGPDGLPTADTGAFFLALLEAAAERSGKKKRRRR